MRATAQLASLPAFAAAALCLFSLVEPSVIAAGRDAPLTARARNACCAAVHTLIPCCPGLITDQMQLTGGATGACIEQVLVSCEPGT